MKPLSPEWHCVAKITPGQLHASSLTPHERVIALHSCIAVFCDALKHDAHLPRAICQTQHGALFGLGCESAKPPRYVCSN